MDFYVKVFATCDRCGKAFSVNEMHKKNYEFTSGYFCQECYDEITGARYAKAPRHMVEVVFCEDCPMYYPYGDGDPCGSCENSYRTVRHDSFCSLGKYYSEKYAKKIANKEEV